MLKKYSSNLANPENLVAAIPAELPIGIAASLAMACLTAFLICERLTKGDTKDKWALIHGASGAVGSVLSQLLKLKNINCIGITSDDAKFDKIFCDHMINRKKQDLVTEVRKLNPAGIDYVFNSSGGKTLERDIGLLNLCGQLMWYGFAESNDSRGMEGALFANFMKGYAFYTHVTALYSREVRCAAIWQLVHLFLDGKLKFSEIRSFNLAQAADAHRLIADSNHSGRIILTIS